MSLGSELGLEAASPSVFAVGLFGHLPQCWLSLFHQG